MGIPLTIFTLHRFGRAEARCEHFLLTRVHQPAFSNADQASQDAAARTADAARDALLRAYERDVLAHECPGAHEGSLTGELQSAPAGDELRDGRGGGYVDVWVAPTRHGAPWVVMGTAPDEGAFWRAVEADDDLSSLGGIRPAVRHRAFFLVDDDAGGPDPNDNQPRHGG